MRQEAWNDRWEINQKLRRNEAIISKDVYLRVHAEIARRANILTDGKKRTYSFRYALSSLAFCGHCGDFQRRIKWNNRGCKSTVYDEKLTVEFKSGLEIDVET